MGSTAATPSPAGATGAPPTSDEVVARLTDLAAGWSSLPLEAGDDAGRVDVIRALEVVKAAASAAQARLAVDLDTSQRQEQAAAGVPAAERGRGVGAQVALARRDSPHRGGRHLGLAKALVHEMPHTLAALQAGRISEWRATILVRETAVLTAADRAAVDVELAGDAEPLRVLEQLGDRALAARAKQVAYRLDPRSVVERSRRAMGERCVTVRPAPDTMAYLTALLPARHAIAAHVALGRVADTARNDGDPRGRGQLMADALVDRLTAPGDSAGAAAATWNTADTATCDTTGTPSRPSAPSSPRTRRGDVAVRLAMTDRALLDGDDEPAHLEGYGPVPAGWARDLVVDALDPPGAESQDASQARVFITRLLTDRYGALVSMESRTRTAPPGMADVIRTRDAGTCRTAWCDAPVRHVDHVVPHAAGGPTTGHNSQGLCESCNYTRQALGWHATAYEPPGADTERGHATREAPGEPPGGPPRRHTVITTTPTGHTYVSTAPSLPGAPRGPSVEAVATEHAAGTRGSLDHEPSDSCIEAWLREHLATAA